MHHEMPSRQSRNQNREKRIYRRGAEYAEIFLFQTLLCALSVSAVRSPEICVRWMFPEASLRT
jgi:hypothetical protein